MAMVRRSYAFFLWVLSLGAALLAFQNCGQAVGEKTDKIAPGGGYSQSVIGDASSYYKIVYDPNLEMAAPIATNNTRLELNLKTGQAISGRSGSQVSCAIPAATLQNLINLMNGAKICKTLVPPDVAVCMAYPLADIELSDDTSTQLLRPSMCAAEIFLCDGRDAQLRELLRQTSCGGN